LMRKSLSQAISLNSMQSRLSTYGCANYFPLIWKRIINYGADGCRRVQFNIGNWQTAIHGRI
jgi:hypothetical protein